jgi:hypothetical protein
MTNPRHPLKKFPCDIVLLEMIDTAPHPPVEMQALFLDKIDKFKGTLFINEKVLIKEKERIGMIEVHTFPERRRYFLFRITLKQNWHLYGHPSAVRIGMTIIFSLQYGNSR